MSKKSFIIQFSHFFTGQAAILMIGLVTFPILTRALPIEQYGMLSFVTNTILFAVAMAKAGLSDGIIRMHEEYTATEDQKITFASTICIGAAGISILVTSLYMLLIPFLSRSFNLSREFQLCFWVMSAYLFVRPLNVANLNLLRANGKTVFINIINVTNKSIAVALGLVLLLFLVHKLYGFFAGIAISEFFIFLFLCNWFFKNYTIRISAVSSKVVRQLIVFGIPLLFSELAYLILSYADRYLILYFHGEKELGIYSAGYNLPMYIAGVITFSVSYSIIPLFVKIYSREGKKPTELFLKDSFHYLLLGVIPICFGYLAVSRDLFVLLASEKYLSAAAFSPIILYGSLFLGLNSVLNAGLYLTKRTKIIFAIICSGVVINIGLNLILIPKFHVTGAAWATLIACCATSILTVFFSYRYIYVGIKKDLFKHIVLSLIMYAAVTQISTDSILLSLCLKILAGASIIIPGVLLIEKEILNKLKYILFKKNTMRNLT